MTINLINGDCLEEMKNIPNKSIDLILTDPPYNTTNCEWDNIIPFDKMWNQLERIIKDGRAIILFGCEPFSSHLRLSNEKLYKYDLIWDKNKGCQPALANIKPMQSHENIHIFGKGKVLYNPQMEKGEPYTRNNKGYTKGEHKIKLGAIVQKNDGFRYPKSILCFPRDFSAQSRLHPTQKPVALMEYLIKTYSNEGDTVLDFTMGSGSCGVGCINTKRNFIGIELDKGYFNIAKDRIEKANSSIFDI